MDRSNLRRNILVCVVLSAVTLWAYWPVVHSDFVDFDDPEYVTDNPHVRPGLSWQGVEWAFHSRVTGNWHPLTMLSHMLDCQFYGLKGGPHHLTNLIFHIANALLLFLLLKRMTGARWQSAFVSGLFALHRLHVESVAWVSERKDVLSTLFALLTFWAYVRFAEFRIQNSKSETRASRIWYGAALFLFALGLMCKPMLVTVPCVLLLLDYWPLRRIIFPTRNFDFPTFQRLILEKLPFFLLAFAVSAVTLVAQHESGAISPLDRLSLTARFVNSAIGYLGYIQKMFWPAHLSLLYLLPKNRPFFQLAIAVAVLVAVSAVVIRFWRRPYLLMGWLWFLGMLVPVIGLVQVGSQSMADRYSYMPLIGLFVMVTWGIADFARGRHGGKITLGLFSSVILASCAIATRSQVRHWTNTRTLFQHAVNLAPNNPVAHHHLGNALAREEKFAEAKAHYLEALRINPFYAGALYNLGVLYALQGEPEKAEDYLNRTIQLDHLSPLRSETEKRGFASAYLKLASLQEAGKKYDEAIGNYQRALELRPELVEALNNLAWIRAANSDARFRNGLDAVRLAERACEISHYEMPIMVGTLAAAYAEAGRFPEAVKTAEMARAIAIAARQDAIAEKNRQLLDLYRAGRAYHEASP